MLVVYIGGEKVDIWKCLPNLGFLVLPLIRASLSIENKNWPCGESSLYSDVLIKRIYGAVRYVPHSLLGT